MKIILWYRTSRKMLWHILWRMQDFTKKDDLNNKTKAELVEHLNEIYAMIETQLNNTEE